MSFGCRLREVRKSKNMTQEEMAQRLDISLNCLANYERGTSFPKEKYLYKIINLLGCEPNYLFQDELANRSEQWLDERMLVENYRKADRRTKNAFRELISIGADNEFGRRILEKDRTVGTVILDVGCGIYGILREERFPNQVRTESRNDKPDFYVTIKGHSMEPIFFEGTVLSVKYTDELDDGNLGLFGIGGYTLIAVKKNGQITDLNRKDIHLACGTENHVLYGKITQMHRTVKKKNADQ